MPLKIILFVQDACAECDRQRAVVEQVKREARGVDFREVDLATGADAVKHYRVREHPTLVLERDGRELKRWIGVTTPEEILTALRLQEAQGQPARAIEVPTAPAMPGGQAPRGTVEPRPEHVPPGQPPMEPSPGPGPPL